MSTRNTETYHPYFAPNPEIEALQKMISDSMARMTYPTWIVSGDKITNAMDVHYRQEFDSIGTVVNAPPPPAPVSREPIMTWDLARVCYHCDATDGVSGVVPLCRKCR